MDIVAHALWTGAGLGFARRRMAIPGAVAAGTVVASVLPDVVHLFPLLAWWAIGSGSPGVILDYAIAAPQSEPLLPPAVSGAAHHLHCILHSAVIAGAVTVFARAIPRRLWPLLAGWWSHIVIDVFTHSAQFYPVPVLYPFTQAGFDGIAWNTPWFIAVNYAALAVTWACLYGSRAR